MSVPAAAGNYRIVQTSAPVNHDLAIGEQVCKATAKACETTFLTASNNNPWFPWDLTGDGFVSGLDFFALLQQFGQAKP